MRCSKCGAEVFIAITPIGFDRAALMLDAEPDPDGSIWLIEDGHGVPVANAAPADDALRYTPHAQTCGTRVSS